MMTHFQAERVAVVNDGGIDHLACYLKAHPVTEAEEAVLMNGAKRDLFYVLEDRGHGLLNRHQVNELADYEEETDTVVQPVCDACLNEIE